VRNRPSAASALAGVPQALQNRSEAPSGVSQEEQVVESRRWPPLGTAVQQTIRLALGREHPPDFRNQHRVAAARLLHKRPPFGDWSLECRLEDLSNSPEIVWRERASTWRLMHGNGPYLL
jgi:hypothetical protein